MGKVEDEDCRVFDGVFDGGVGDDVFGEGDGGEVFDVFVEVVYEACELLGFGTEFGGGVVAFRIGRHGDSLFVDPHLDFGFEELGVLCCVLGNNFGDGGAPSVHPVSMS